MSVSEPGLTCGLGCVLRRSHLQCVSGFHCVWHCLLSTVVQVAALGFARYESVLSLLPDMTIDSYVSSYSQPGQSPLRHLYPLAIFIKWAQVPDSLLETVRFLEQLHCHKFVCSGVSCCYLIPE